MFREAGQLQVLFPVFLFTASGLCFRSVPQKQLKQ
jgi:hypothetical protein